VPAIIRSKKSLWQFRTIFPEGEELKFLGEERVGIGWAFLYSHNRREKNPSQGWGGNYLQGGSHTQKKKRKEKKTQRRHCPNSTGGTSQERTCLEVFSIRGQDRLFPISGGGEPHSTPGEDKFQLQLTLRVYGDRKRVQFF